MNSSSESILGNKSLQISLDRSDVEKYLPQSQNKSSDNVGVESDTSEDYKTSQKKHEQLKQKPVAVNNTKAKAAKITSVLKLRSRQIEIKQQPQDEISTDDSTLNLNKCQPKKAC